MAIKKIIVELADQEATFREFSSIDEFLTSDFYKSETVVVTDAEVVPETVTVEVPIEPTVAEPAAEPVQ